MAYRFKILSFFLLIVATTAPLTSKAQSYLQKKITLHVQQAPVNQVLKLIEQQTGCTFSYNSSLFNADSLVSVQYKSKTVNEVLNQLFNNRFRYQISNEHVIILPAVSNNYWYVSGQVIDVVTGEPLAYASVFEPLQLVGTMTDERGYFKLQLKEKKPNTKINITKVAYADTVIALSTEHNQQDLKLGLQQVDYTLDTIVISSIERNWLARRFLSSKQQLNSLNLNSFFAKQPFQFSFTPGLGSHGRMGAQVVNKFSLNIIGGYTAGVNGVEIGSLFNMVKKDAQYVQVAGLFNIVGGSLKGVQAGGLYNTVMKDVDGVQLSGLTNIVSGTTEGVQLGGVYNHNKNIKGVQAAGVGNVTAHDAEGVVIAGVFNGAQNMNGTQIAGVANYTHKKTKGLQISAVVNSATVEMNGMQISGFVNYTKKLKGMQIGLVNIADSSEGYSIGLVNINRHGYHKASFSTNELQQLQLAYKSGSARLYSMLVGGFNLSQQQKLYSFGYGLGSDYSINKTNKWFLNPELMHLYVYNGNLNNRNLLSRMQLHVKYKFNHHINIHTGPAFSVLYHKTASVPDDWKANLNGGFPTFDISPKVKCWMGWSLGFDIF